MTTSKFFICGVLVIAVVLTLLGIVLPGEPTEAQAATVEEYRIQATLDRQAAAQERIAQALENLVRHQRKCGSQ